MGIDKKVQEILSKPSEMKFADVQNIFEFFGYVLLKFNGSHACFYESEK